ncbi:MAG: hypothetical protein ACE5HV_18565, partial [Acidobacteriota bacterium]
AADAQAAAGRPEKEIEALSRAVKLAADRGTEAYPLALRKRADLYFRQQLFELALEDYRPLMTLNSQDAYPAIRAGRCLDALERGG